MKSSKMLMMAVLTIISVSVFAQVSTNLQAKVTNQNPEKVKYTCPMYPDMVMDKLGVCPKNGTTLNLSLKEKMKMEVMKINSSLMHPEVINNMPCNFSKNGSALNLSPKEKMKMGAMKINTNRTFPDVMTSKNYMCPKCGMDMKEMNMAYSCQMMTVLKNDKQVCCLGCISTLNLSTKEKMKMEVMKI
jgi:hypothetical protein